VRELKRQYGMVDERPSAKEGPPARQAPVQLALFA
jgi:hypothetical protein